MKHHWHEAAFIPEVADTGWLWAVASRFRAPSTSPPSHRWPMAVPLVGVTW